MKVTHREYVNVELEPGRSRTVRVQSPNTPATGWVFRYNGTTESALFLGLGARRNKKAVDVELTGPGGVFVGSMRNGFFGLECRTPGTIREAPGPFGRAFWRDPMEYIPVRQDAQHTLRFRNNTDRPVSYRLLVETRSYDSE